MEDKHQFKSGMLVRAVPSLTTWRTEAQGVGLILKDKPETQIHGTLFKIFWIHRGVKRWEWDNELQRV